MKNSQLLGKKITAPKLKRSLRVTDLVDNYFQAYNAARLSEACQLFVQKMLDPRRDVTIGLTLAGAMTPAGLSGIIVSAIQKGFIDFIISTGANLYHDMHFALNYPLHKGTWQIDDKILWDEKIVRIYDIFLTTDTLLDTDKYSQKIILDKKAPQGVVSSAEWHHYFGRCLLRDAPNPQVSILAQAARLNVPVYTSSPGDSTLGMDLTAYSYLFHDGGVDIHINPNLDVAETTAIIYGAKENGAIVVGGGSPKNFYMQTQPMLWECLGVEKGGHDYFIQLTMDSPQWGGLSGATPQEAVSWGKINPLEIKNTVVVYLDATVSLPILLSYANARAKKRKQKKLYLKRQELLAKLRKETVKKPLTWMPDYQR